MRGRERQSRKAEVSRMGRNILAGQKQGHRQAFEEEGLREWGAEYHCREKWGWIMESLKVG